MRGIQTTWVPQVVTTAALLWALNPSNPYGYYVLLRWLCFVVFAYLAYLALERGKETWVWLAGGLALIYNPFVRFHLTRDTWSLINVVTAVVALASIRSLRPFERAERAPSVDSPQGPAQPPEAAGTPEPAALEPISTRAANRLMQQGKLRQAELILREVLARDPTDAMAFLLMSSCLEKMGDKAGVLAFQRGVAASSKHCERQRLWSLEAITRLEPGDLGAWRQLAGAHLALKDTRGALEALMKLADGLEAEERTDERWSVLGRIGAIYFREPKSLGAVADILSTGQDRLETLRKASPYIGELCREAMRIATEWVEEALRRDPLVEADANLGSYVGEIGILRASPRYLSRLLERVELVKSLARELPEGLGESATQNPHDLPDAFDPNLLIAAFSRVRLRPGWILDYVYRGTTHEGSPLLYARRTSEAPLCSVSEFAARYSIEPSGFAPNFPDVFVHAMEVDNSPAGALELAVLLNEAPQFYWSWHALYEAHEIAPTPPAEEDLESYEAEGSDRVRACVPGAEIRWTEDEVSVELLTRGHDAYAISTWTIKRPGGTVRSEHRAIAHSSVKVLF